MDRQTEYEIEIERRAMQRETVTTDIAKSKFINEIRNGLGEEIKKGVITLEEEEVEVKKEKTPWYKKFFRVIGL